MTFKEIVKEGQARNKALRPEDCVFQRSDARALSAWAKVNGVSWVDNTDVTTASIEDMLDDGKDRYCVVALEGDGGGVHQLAAPLTGGSRTDVLGKWRLLWNRNLIILDRKAVLQPRELAAMDF